MTTPPILIQEYQGIKGSVGHIILNREDQLNAINHRMSEVMERALRAWDDQSHIKAIVITGSGDRAFCAGGDLKEVATMIQKPDTQDFLKQEYRCIHQLACMKTPCIALCHGITMGGGTGTMRHMPIRIGSPDLSLAMPETSLGFIPDVGASYFLPQCPKHTGRYLALSSKRLNADEAHALGFIQHIIPKDAFAKIIEAIVHTEFGDDPLAILHSLMEPYALPVKLIDWPDTVSPWFAFDDIASIKQALEKADDPLADTILATLNKRSPWSLALALRTLCSSAAQKDLKHALNIEYSLAKQSLLYPDLALGIEAALHTKNQPLWHQDVPDTKTIDAWMEEAIASNPLSL